MTTTTTLRLEGTGPVVMVDDSHVDFDIASRMYARSELENEFIHFASGAALIAHLDGGARPKGVLPALVLMDLNMPGMDGIETTATLRSRPEYRDLPLVAMLTSSLDPKDRERAERIGAVAYFPKPLRPSDYIVMFNSLQH